jgi:hypothetical protein
MSTQKQVPVRIDMQEINREAIGLGHSQRMLLEALSRATITASPDDAQAINRYIRQMTRDEISIVWSIGDLDDALTCLPEADRETWTTEESKEALRQTKHYHDASIGVNWDVLRVHVESVFDKRNEASPPSEGAAP